MGSGIGSDYCQIFPSHAQFILAGSWLFRALLRSLTPDLLRSSTQIDALFFAQRPFD